MYELGSFAIIFNPEGKVLLGHRRDMDIWNLPGGHVEKGELPSEAVIRETYEETGLEVEIVRLAGVYLKPKKSQIVFSFECRITGGELHPTSETDRSEYFNPSQIPANTSPKHVERILDAMDHSEPVFRRQQGKSTKDLLSELGLD